MSSEPRPPAVLDLGVDVLALTRALVDVESVSRDEAAIADAVEASLRLLPHLEVTRLHHTVVARTDLGHAERVVLAGHLDTVPVNGNWPSRLEQEPGDPEGGVLHGLGTCDMKGGDAVMLRLAAGVPQPDRDVTFVFYEAEEIDERFNGLRLVATERPDLLAGDFAILLEPSDGQVEAGCQGTLRALVRTTGERAHSARSWRGVNAIHAAAEVLERLRDHEPRRVVIDGLEYREGLNAVGISGGVAGNVVPDLCEVTVNYRFAPDRSAEEAEAFVRGLLDGFEVEVVDLAGGALPGLERPAAREFVEAVGGRVGPKYGWTDVARFSALGVPAVNFGPGDPMFAHKADEHVPVAQLFACERALRRWLGGGDGADGADGREGGPTPAEAVTTSQEGAS